MRVIAIYSCILVFVPLEFEYVTKILLYKLRIMVIGASIGQWLHLLCGQFALELPRRFHSQCYAFSARIPTECQMSRCFVSRCILFWWILQYASKPLNFFTNKRKEWDKEYTLYSISHCTRGYSSPECYLLLLHSPRNNSTTLRIRHCHGHAWDRVNSIPKYALFLHRLSVYTLSTTGDTHIHRIRPHLLFMHKQHHAYRIIYLNQIEDFPSRLIPPLLHLTRALFNFNYDHLYHHTASRGRCSRPTLPINF